jgi:hypothetical protein
MRPPKFLHPILETVEICKRESMDYRVGCVSNGRKWIRFCLSSFDSVLNSLDDENNYPSILKMRKRKKN